MRDVLIFISMAAQKNCILHVRNDSSLVLSDLEVGIGKEEEHFGQLFAVSPIRALLTAFPGVLTGLCRGGTYLAFGEEVWHVLHRICAYDRHVLIAAVDSLARSGVHLCLRLTRSEDPVIHIGGHGRSDLHT